MSVIFWIFLGWQASLIYDIGRKREWWGRKIPVLSYVVGSLLPLSSFPVVQSLNHTAKTQYNKFEIFSEKELRGLSPNFHIHVSVTVSDLYVFTGSVCLFCCRKICGPTLGTFSSFLCPQVLHIDKL
jgi:hypothetical protein